MIRSTYPKLYKLDKDGRVRFHQWERKENSFRSITGLVGGSVVEGEWKFAKSTNDGRSNERSADDQADFHITQDIERKITRLGYTEDESGRGVIPHFQPMLANKYDSKKHAGMTFSAQPKLDGIRCIARADGLWTRNGKRIVSCQHVIDALKPLFDTYPDAVIDGELYNHDLKNDFEKITSLVRKTNVTAFDLMEIAQLVQYHVYDAPISGYVDDAPFNDRFLWLEAAIDDLDGAIIRAVPTYMDKENQNDIDELYGEWLEAGYEGQMLRMNETYDNFRSNSLLKRKEFVDDEFEIIRLEEGVGAWSGATKRVVCKMKNGVEFAAGIRGTYDLNVQRLRDSSDYVGGVATIRFQNLTGTKNSVPRFGVAVDLVKRGEDRN